MHTNLKPSKLLFDPEKGDARFILTGLELSEKMNKAKLNRSRSGTPRKKRSYENIFSSLNVHAGESIKCSEIVKIIFFVERHWISR